MRIDAGTLSFAYQQMMQGNALNFSAAATNTSTRQSAPASEASAPVATGTAVDFTNMSPQELATWTKQQVRQGSLSSDESSPLLALAAQDSSVTGTSTSGTGSINYIDRIQEEIDDARWNNNQSKLNLLLTAASVVHLYQSEQHGVRALA